jgi:hypothetical protein
MMSAVVEVHIASCDWEKIQALTMKWEMPLERVLTAVIVRGVLECSQLPSAPTPEHIQEWCESAYIPLTPFLESIS